MVFENENLWFFREKNAMPTADHPRNLFWAPNTGEAQYFFPRIFLIRPEIASKKAGDFRKWKAPAKPRSIVALHSALQIRSAYDVLHPASERF